MQIDTKVTSPLFEIKALSDKGELEGYASTFGGEPDDYGDVIASGAFSESIDQHNANKTMPKMFWQHDRDQPIGRWLDLKEDDQGLLVRGKLNMGVQRGREAYELLKEGDIDGLSIGYRIKEYSVDADSGIWTLERLELREISVVSIGANPNALINSVKALKQSHELTDRLKAGDQLSEREFELWLKGLGFSNSQAERTARLHLKGQGEPAEAEKGRALFQALLK